MAVSAKVEALVGAVQLASRHLNALGCCADALRQPGLELLNTADANWASLDRWS